MNFNCQGIMIEFPVTTNVQEFIYALGLASMPHRPGLAEHVLREAGSGGQSVSPYELQKRLYSTTVSELYGKRQVLGGDIYAVSWFAIGFHGWIELATRFGLPIPPWLPDNSFNVRILILALFDLGVEVSIEELNAFQDKLAKDGCGEPLLKLVDRGLHHLAESVTYLSAAAIRRGHRVGLHIPASSVFISYSHRDEAWVGMLKKFLEYHAVRVWLAPYDLRAGAKLDANLQNAIQAYECLVIVLTAESLVSEWVAMELEAAIATNKQVVAVSLVTIAEVQDTELWKALSRFLVLDCHEFSPLEAFREILRSLQKRELDLTRWAYDEGSAFPLFFGERA